MLAWMTSELLKAEQAGERVHILSHVPAGHISSDCYFIFPLFLTFIFYVISHVPAGHNSSACYFIFPLFITFIFYVISHVPAGHISSACYFIFPLFLTFIFYVISHVPAGHNSSACYFIFPVFIFSYSILSAMCMQVIFLLIVVSYFLFSYSQSCACRSEFNCSLFHLS